MEENSQLRKHVELQVSISQSYETELGACREAMKILGSEMKRAAKAADKWRSEATRLEKEGGKEEVERLTELCEELEQALYNTQEEMRMIETKGGRGPTGLPTPTEEDDNFVSFAATSNGRNATDLISRNLSGEMSDTVEGAPSQPRDEEHYLEPTRSLTPGNRSASSMLPPPSPQSPKSSIPAFEGSRTADGPTVRPDDTTFERLLSDGERSIQRREDEEWQVLHDKVSTLQDDLDRLITERDGLLAEKNQVRSISLSRATTSKSKSFQMEIDARREQEYHEKLFSHTAQLETRLDETSKQLDAALEQLDALRARFRTVERENAEMEERTSSLTEANRKLRDELDVAEARLADGERERAWLQRELAEMESRVVHEDRDRVKDKVVWDAQVKEAQAAREWDRQEHDREVARLQAELEEERRRRANDQSQAAKESIRQKELTAMKARTSAVEQANATLELQITSLKKQASLDSEDKVGLNIALDAKQQELDLVRFRISLDMRISD